MLRKETSFNLRNTAAIVVLPLLRISFVLLLLYIIVPSYMNSQEDLADQIEDTSDFGYFFFPYKLEVVAKAFTVVSLVIATILPVSNVLYGTVLMAMALPWNYSSEHCIRKYVAVTFFCFASNGLLAVLYIMVDSAGALIFMSIVCMALELVGYRWLTFVMDETFIPIWRRDWLTPIINQVKFHVDQVGDVDTDGVEQENNLAAASNEMSIE